MTKLAVYSFGNQEIRTVTDEHGGIWFVANDVCAALELGNPRQAIASHVDEGDVQSLDTPTPGGMQAVNHVNESGLYALIFGSRKESAKQFKRWVTHEVLPAIRKDGQYVAKAPAPQRATATFPFKTQWYDCPPRPLEQDFRNVEMLAQFAGLSRADKLTLLVKAVLQHDEYFATIVAAARDRVKELDNVKDSSDAIEHSLSAH
jgi:prophage antirepressor-like protein